jgi:chemotaxis protein histidine kinase CheA
MACWSIKLAFLGILLNAACQIDIAIAQQPPSAATFYEPTLAAEYPPKYVSPCPDCADAARRLNSVWTELENFDAAHPDARAVFQATDEAAKADAALVQATADADAAAKAAKDPKNKDKDKQAKKDAADAAKAAAKKTKNGADAKKKQERATFDKAHPGTGSDDILNDLNKLLEKLNQYAQMLRDCEKTAKEAGKCGEKKVEPVPPEKPTIGGGSSVTGSGTPYKLPPCWESAAQKKKVSDELAQMQKDAQTKLAYLRHQANAAQSDIDAAQANVGAINKLIEDADKIVDCKDKKGGE